MITVDNITCESGCTIRIPRHFPNARFMGNRIVCGIECEYWLSDNGFHNIAPVNYEFLVASAQTWEELEELVKQHRSYRPEPIPKSIYCHPQCNGPSTFTGFTTLIEVCQTCGLEKSR